VDLNYKTVNIFPVPVHQFDVNGFSEIQDELIDYVYKMREKDPVGNTISNRRGWQSSCFSLENEDDILQNFLTNCLSEFPPIEKSIKLFVSAWININPPEAFNLKHNHPTSDLSGVLWIKSQKNFPIDLDFDDGILPNLNKELISKKVKVGDELEIKLNLSKILKDDKFKKTTFHFEIISIEEKIKFELTKEFLDKNGFKTEKDLKEFLVSNMKTQYEQGIKQIEKKELMDLLDNNYKFELPDGVLEDDFNQIWSRLENAKKEGTLDEDDKLLKDDDLKKRYKKISERRVKLGLLMQHIASEEKIVVSEEEINKGILEYTRQYPGQEKQIMEYFEKNPSSLDTIRAPLIEQKVIDSIISKSKTNVIKLNEDEYKKLEVKTFDIKDTKK